MADAEQVVHRMLAPHRVRKRRELFKIDVATAQQLIRAVAGSQPQPGHTFLGVFSRLLVSRRPDIRRQHFQPRRSSSWRYGRCSVPNSVRLLAGLVAIGALIALLDPSMWP